MAEGDLEVACSGSQHFGWQDFGLSGQAASDGTFTLAPQLSTSFPLTIEGKLPPNGATTWIGTYSLGSSVGCSVNQIANFTATVLPSLDGAYTGSLKGSGVNSGQTVTFASSFTQGAPAFALLGNGSTVPYIPLSSSSTVSGSACFSSGISASGIDDSIEGDFFQLNLAMNDGSKVMLMGTYLDPSGSSLNVSIFVTGGVCDNYLYTGTLTRH